MDKGTRPMRNRKNSRRSWTPVHGDIHRPIKRLFTPEIKRMLKDWLVRRRENPYPSREEKKSLAQKTGLTYIQICNWFANWRRKLKNAGKEPQKNTWGNLIKNYNDNARGNVEQFSICSSDSIWEDEERRNEYFESKSLTLNAAGQLTPIIQFNECNSYEKNTFDAFQIKDTNGNFEAANKSIQNEHDLIDNENKANKPINYTTEQCYQLDRTTFLIRSQVSSTTNNINGSSPLQSFGCFSNPKYKNKIMAKCLRGLGNDTDNEKNKCGYELSKWLESAAKFTPEKNNYIDWNSKGVRSNEQYPSNEATLNNNNHQKEELDAAEALTFLAGNCKSQWLK